MHALTDRACANVSVSCICPLLSDAIMRCLRHLAALQSLLSSTSVQTGARSCAVADCNAYSTLQTTVTPLLGFVAAAGARSYASDAGSTNLGIESRRDSSSNASTSLSAGDQSADSEDWMEEWARLLEKNDVMGQADLLRRTFGDTPEPEGPPLHELLNYNRKEEERAKRRMYELNKQEQIRQNRVRVVDDFGRAYGTGKRKTSIARVWLAAGTGQMSINGRSLHEYFPLFERRADVLDPFCTTNTLGLFDVRASVKGGGTTGQAQAMRHGISKALQLFEPELRPALKAEGLLTRDSRIVERKKPGKAKARKSFQWVKR